MPSSTGGHHARGAGILLGILAVFALAVAGVVGLLSGRATPPANACVARLPDGTSYSLSAGQSRNAALISAIAVQRELPARAVTIALATAMQESRLENIGHGDRDSLGLFQQRPSQGWGTPEQVTDPVYATNAFFDALVAVEGYENLEITVAAQEVQRSAFPDAYAQHEGLARAFASALTGHSAAALACDVAGPEDGIAPTDGFPADFGAIPLTPALDGSGSPLEGPGGEPLLITDTAAWPGLGAIEPVRAGWAAASWLTATASESGVSVVVVGDVMWTSGSLEWVDAGGLAQPGGGVLLG